MLVFSFYLSVYSSAGWPGLEPYSAKPRSWRLRRRVARTNEESSWISLGLPRVCQCRFHQDVPLKSSAGWVPQHKNHQQDNRITQSLEFTPGPRLLFIPTPRAQPPPPSLNSQFSIVNSQLRRSRDPYGQGCAPKVCSHLRTCQFRDTSLPCLASMTRNLQSSGGFILSDFPEEGIFLIPGSPLQNTRNSVAKSSKTHRKLATNRRSPHGNLGSAAETCDKPLASIAFLAETSCNRSLFA